MAGGLNVYGFANGDPVSYSDPFGLCCNLGVLQDASMVSMLANARAQEFEKRENDIRGGMVNAMYQAAIGLGLSELAEGAAGDGASVEPSPAEAPAIPNPGGRLGSAAHRGTVSAAADEIEAAGGKIVAGGARLPERAVAVDNGTRIRYPDIEAVKADGSRVYVNVGRETKAGRPVAREARALDDLSKTGVKSLFVPYKP